MEQVGSLERAGPHSAGGEEVGIVAASSQSGGVAVEWAW